MADYPDQYDCTERIVEATPDAAIVANLGVSAYNLAAVEDRARNFYMRGGMGVTTPTGLGLALATDEQVTVLEGDGSLLMSLGCLSTVADQDPSNLVVVVMDNSRFETTGGQPSLSARVDFAAVAADCGLWARHVDSVAALEEAYEAAVAHDGAAVVSCDVVSSKPESFPDIDYAHSFLKHRFREALLDDQ